MILDIVLIIGILFLGFLFYRQDKIIKTQIDYTEKIETNALETHKAISTALAKMKAADDKGGFESDDEVGMVFKILQDILVDLEKELKGE